MLIDLDRQPKFAALLGLAWLMVALVLLLLHWPQTAQTLLDTDDAMRLVEMRAWLNGPGLLSGWYDLHQSRLQPPGGVDMHWSRLIDAGLAGLFTFFHLFADQADAERLMRAWWPLLWLLPDHGGHDRDCVADCRPRSGDGCAALRDDLPSRRTSSSRQGGSIITTFRSRSRC